MENARPAPDEILARIAGENAAASKGHLKIYLGMAAGVGKTYAMLNDAHDCARRGIDVVIGYLEPHGREDTERMADGFERLPLKSLEHRGVPLSEFDADGAIVRRPGLLLVDELAHTNVPGSRQAKRYQDIEEILDAGIDVATTVNIQHIESLRDVVAQITGVFVKETVPDAFFERANEIELVDIPPEELRQRLLDGKVYHSEKVQAALEGFFKKGNLLALRELALRRTAEQVDGELRRTRNLSQTSVPWHVHERILVCVAPNRMAERVLRAARRLAGSLHAEMIAVSVTSPRQSVSEQALSELHAALRLAESMGARTVTLAGEDIVAELIAFANRENVTTIVMGKPVRPRLKEILFGSVVDATLRQSGDIDVLVITGQEAAGTPVGLAQSARQVDSPGITRRGAIESVTAIALATALGRAFVPESRNANSIMIYLVAVTVVSLRHGRQESLLTAILAVAAYDYFFIPPFLTLTIHDPRDFLTAAVMLMVSLVLSNLTLRLKAQSRAASTRERNTGVLFDLSRKLAGTRSKAEMAAYAIERIETIFGAPAAVFRRASTGQLTVLAPSTSGFEQAPSESAVAAWVVDHGRPAGSSTDTLAGSRGYYLPLSGSEGPFGALAIDLDGQESLDMGRKHLAEAVASQLATALERAQFAKASHEADLRAESERIRGDLLSSVSHDLRTPLASITGAASGLAAQSELSERSRELVGTISEEADRMSRLVRNLLDMTRVQGKVELSLDWHALEEVVGSAIDWTQSLLDQQPQLTVENGPVLVRVDGLLIERVLVNLLENAARYAGRAALVQISVRKIGSEAQIVVRDNGPGVPPELQSRIFERSFRVDSSNHGTGLGLAISRAAVEAHGGTIQYSSGSPGATFTVTLPLGPEPLS